MTAAAAVLATGIVNQAHAQEAVASVCTGVSLPASAVTSIVGNVLVPVVTPLETLLSAITLGTVNLGLTGALTSAANGAPISISALDINGNAINVLATPECVSQADAFEITDPAGLAIGGGRITGLGTRNPALEANATELNAIALGDGAATGAGATGAVALGAGASVTATGALGSVALGQNSVATGATLATQAYLTNTTAPAEVNIGGRRLTGLADGATATDAITVGQLQAATAGLTADALPFNAALGAYDAARAGVPTQITNVAAGALSATSDDAVNGAQLFATNSGIFNLGTSTATNLGGGSVLNPNGSVSAPAYALTTVGAGGATTTTTYNDVGSALAGLGGSVTNVNTRITAVSDRAVMYDGAVGSPRGLITLAGTGGTRITNLTPGALTAASTDAVNGAQLFATNQQVAGNTTAITNLTNNIANGTADPQAVRYSDATRTTLALAGAGGTRVTNVTAGAVNATSTDAVNGAQLNATNQTVANLGTSVATSLGGGSVVNVDGSVSAPSYALTTVGGGGATTTTTYNNVGSALSGLGASITNVNNRITAVSDRAVTYDGAAGSARDTITLAGAAGTRITNVAAGAVNATSTDAVNGAQLNGVGQQVAANTTAITANTTNITNLQNGTAGFFRTNNTAGSAAPVVSGTNSVAGGGGAVASGASSLALGAGATASGTNSVALGAGSLADRANSVSVGSAATPRQITNVAAGTSATDAVNLGQLNSGLNQTLVQANAFTDARLAEVGFDLRRLRRSANGGTAAAMAIAAIPQAFGPGMGIIGGGISTWGGEQGFAIGVSKATPDGDVVIKAAAALNSRGKGGATAGVGFAF
ncbi:MAG: YadA-like family protein [Novosphingobium sp.]